MDISGPVREVLRRHYLPWTAEDIANPLFFLVRMAALAEHAPAELPGYLREDAGAIMNAGGWGRPVFGYLALSGLLHTVPRVRRSFRDQMEMALRVQVNGLAESAQKLLATRNAPAMDFLWHYWLMVLARKRVGTPAPELLLKVLWKKAWSGQTRTGQLHPVNEKTTESMAAYQDLCALHAAYNAIVFSQDYDLFPPVQSLADWHVANTAAGSVTHEPWGLAAFAALDETRSLAGAMVEEATRALVAKKGGAEESMVIAALLADAVWTQEETAAGLG